jgi:hypothetical protein
MAITIGIRPIIIKIFIYAISLMLESLAIYYNISFLPIIDKYLLSYSSIMIFLKLISFFIDIKKHIYFYRKTFETNEEYNIEQNIYERTQNIYFKIFLYFYQFITSLVLLQNIYFIIKYINFSFDILYLNIYIWIVIIITFIIYFSIFFLLCCILPCYIFALRMFNFRNLAQNIGVPIEVINSIRQITNPKETICCICLEENKENENNNPPIIWYHLSCNHKIHKECLDIWIKNHNSCPTCRKEITITNEENV